MNVLFIDPPSLEGLVVEKAGEKRLPTPNMGIVYIASYLKLKTEACMLILDAAAERITSRSVTDIIKDFDPSLVCISSKTFNILSTYKYAKLVKNIVPQAIVLVGGAHSTALPEHTLHECPDIDAVVMREGEDTVLEVYSRIKGGYSIAPDAFENVAGIVWRNPSGRIIHNKERDLIADLDSLPFPDLSLVDYKKYRRVYNPNKHRFQHIYSVFSSRGCPFQCTFCMPLLTRKRRARSIENVLDEIDLLHRRYGTQRVYFEDSLFCSRREWFEMFCEEYSRRGLYKKVQWGFETRIDTVDSTVFQQAKQAGCIYAFFGVESGSEEVLRRANKAYSKDAIVERIAAAKRAGIDQVNMSIILGLPYETRETIEETLCLIEEAPCDNAGINILDIYPGTAVFEMADKGEGGLRWIEGKRMNWSVYSREEPMVEVNDVNAAHLIASRNRALSIVTKKSRKNTLRLNLKRLAYIKELLNEDRAKLVKDIVETCRGRK